MPSPPTPQTATPPPPFVNLEAAPIHAPDSAAYRALLHRVRSEMRALGCARIPAFVKPDHQAALSAEVRKVSTHTHYSNGQITPYFNADEPDLPPDHPRRRFSEFSNGFAAMDRFPADGICMTLYRHPMFMAFVQDCLEEPALYPFDDPLAGVVVNTMPNGTQLPWHFDTNEFIVSLMTQDADAGGAFEYCPEIRKPGDENYGAVKAVLDGDRSRVRQLHLAIGDLQIFRGRFSLHRVTRVTGERHTAIFGYAKEPGFIGRVKRTMDVHGRVTKAHIDAEARARSDGLDD